MYACIVATHFEELHMEAKLSPGGLTCRLHVKRTPARSPRGRCPIIKVRHIPMIAKKRKLAIFIGEKLRKQRKTVRNLSVYSVGKYYMLPHCPRWGR